jgi:DNA-binding transcriptional regulator LsrR (DeoR family)
LIIETLLTSPTSEDLKIELMARIAWMYYEENQTHEQIAQRLGIPRIKVTRLLAQARTQRIVEVTVHSDKVPYFRMESDLRQKYGLIEAIVTIDADEGERLYRVLAKAAALALEQRLTPGSIVGIGFGHTLSYLPEFLHLTQAVDCTFTTLIGQLPASIPGDHNYELLYRLAEVTGGNRQYIISPATVAREEIKNILLSDPGIQKSLQYARRSDMAIFSLGPCVAGMTLYQYGLVDDAELAELQALGALGDALGHFFDGQGREVPTRLGDCLIGLNIAEIKSIPTRMIVAGGPDKYQAIQAALQGRIGNVLVTDAGTARWLLSSPLGASNSSEEAPME